jgi:hypothetical protein
MIEEFECEEDNRLPLIDCLSIQYDDIMFLFFAFLRGPPLSILN